jgi:hypothetical protein
MGSTDALFAQIDMLMVQLAENSLNLKAIEDKNMWLRTNELLLVRTEILKSIAHRQAILIKAFSDAEYREAA